MEFIREHIHMNQCRKKGKIQIVLEEDFNVSDSKEDILKIILEKGAIELEPAIAREEKAILNGKLRFAILYETEKDNRIYQTMEGQISFTESLNLDGITGDEKMDVNWELEDLAVHMIHSRKISVKAIVSFEVEAWDYKDVAFPMDIEDGEGIEYIKKTVDLMEIVCNRKDTIRVKEELDLPSNHQNIQNILWTDTQLRHVETRLNDGSVMVTGEVAVFVLYEGAGEEGTIQWIENIVPFRGSIEDSMIQQEHIPHIQVRLERAQIDKKADYDGEERVLALDGVVELSMRIYEEKTIETVSDLYSCVSELIPVQKQENLERLFMKNTAVTRVSENCSVDEQMNLLQICHCQGVVKTDKMQVLPDGVMIEGVIHAGVLCVTADDREPLLNLKVDIPFAQLVEGNGIHEDYQISVVSSLESINATMTGKNEVEVKVVLRLECFVVVPVEESLIEQVEENELDMEVMNSMPGMIGYMVEADDTLWKIAKTYYTTMDEIREINHMSAGEVKRGDKILVVKKGISG